MASSIALTADGDLVVVSDDATLASVAAWLPRHLSSAARDADARSARAVIDVTGAERARTNRTPRRAPADARVVATFGSVVVHASGDSLLLATEDGDRLYGTVDAAGGRATLRFDTTVDGPATGAALTVAAATLLGRLGRALVHAAAVVAPDGRAWLLTGDTHAGKSTTCATLLDAGWKYCSDDHVVLGEGPGGRLVVEGWPRILHLDRGWDDGRPVGGARDAVDAMQRWPGQWQLTAPLAGILLPVVQGEKETRLERVPAAARLVAVIRQSPWLFADVAAAPAVLALLRRAAVLPGARLCLGRDSFRLPDRLTRVLAPVVERDGTGAAPVPDE